jgi:hypothetical protein
MARPGYLPDFLAYWLGARQLLAGVNPYDVAPVAAPYHIREPLYYPLPTALAMLPLAPLPAVAAGVLFVALSSALLALGLTREGTARLPLFLSAPFLMAAALGQWAPLLVAGALLPGLGWTAALKPNIGLPMIVYRPTRAAVAGGLLLALAGLLVMPSWPALWLRNVRALPGHPPPLLLFGGPVLALALLRWRRPEARLLLALACVPQMPLFADQLPLFLVPASLRQSLALALASGVAAALWIAGLQPGVHPSEPAARLVVPLLYLPCLAMVLRRPNVGEAPWRPLAALLGRRVLAPPPSSSPE